MGNRTMKIWVAANQKGGVGKSVTAYSFAHYLVDKKDQRVLFVDMDEQGSGSRSMRVLARDLMASQFFGSKAIAGESLTGQIVLAKSDPGLREIETAYTSQAKHAELLNNLKARFADVRKEFDWCVVDTPGSNSVIAGAMLAAADFVLVPSIIDDYSIDVATKMLKRIIGVQKTVNPGLVNLGILPTIFNATAPSQKRDLETLLRSFSQYVTRTKLSNRTAYREAAGEGIPVWKMKKTSARDAAEEMIAAFDLIAEKMGVGA